MADLEFRVAHLEALVGQLLASGGGGGSTLTIEELDGAPSVAATKLVLPNATLAVVGAVATYTPSVVTAKYIKGAAWSGFGAAIAPAAADLVFVEAPVTGTIVSATMLGSILGGSASVEVWKTSYAAAPPTSANKISAAAPPTIAAATKSRDTTLTGWTLAVTAGDVLAFKLLTCTTFTWLEVILEIQP